MAWRRLALLLLTLAACSEPEPENQPLATDYLPSRSREAEQVITCEGVEGSSGVAILVAAVTDAETEAVTYRYARIPADDVADACRRCGGTYRLATTKEIANVGNDEGTSFTKDGFTFRGGKKASAGDARFWVSSEAFTDPFHFDRPKDDELEPADADHAVMCMRKK